jgi:hypothetical protein
MPTERQIVAILALLGATVTLGLAVYNVYLSFSNNSLRVINK